jgi:Ca2+/Na+ antiporter
MNREKSLIKISRIVGFLMFFIIVIVAYLISSLISWDLNVCNWNLLSIFVMIAGAIYALLSLRYNSNETKIELDNARSIDGKMKPLYEEIRNKTKAASIEQKYAIIQQCAKMEDLAKSVNDDYVYRVSQRLEYVMSEALGISLYQAKDYFRKRNSGLDMEILSTIRNNVVLRDFLVYFFNLYSYVSAGTIDFDGGESSFSKIADLCTSIEKSFGLSHAEARNIIEAHTDR